MRPTRQLVVRDVRGEARPLSVGVVMVDLETVPDLSKTLPSQKLHTRSPHSSHTRHSGNLRAPPDRRQIWAGIHINRDIALHEVMKRDKIITFLQFERPARWRARRNSEA